MKRIALAVLVLVCGCLDGPEEPDTTIPVVEIPFTTQVGNDVSYTIEVFDDGNNVVSVVGDTDTGRHADGELTPSGYWSVEFNNLPPGNHNVTITATDSAGWTGTAEDDVDA